MQNKFSDQKRKSHTYYKLRRSLRNWINWILELFTAEFYMIYMATLISNHRN